MEFVELGRHIAGKNLKSVYFVTGDDPFIVRSALSMFASLTGSMKELNYTVFRSDANKAQMVASLSTPPMLADYRVTVIEGYLGELDWLSGYLSSADKSSVLVFTGELTANFTPFISQIEVVDCNKLDSNFLANWIVKKASSLGAVFQPDAAILLSEYCNRDMNRISGELNKLVDYSMGSSVTPEVVKALVAPDLEFKVYELGETIATKNAEKAVKITETLLAENNSPISLLSMLFNHFRRLLFVSLNPTSDTLSSDLKVKEFAVKMAIKQAKAFSPRRLKAVVDKLNALDADVKGGRMIDKTALISFVCETVLIA